jgi:hypothetical protein
MQLSSAVAAMRAALADGEWHSRREITVIGSAHVTPVQALSTGERMRVSRNPKERRQKRSREDLLRLGAYKHAYLLLSGELRSNKYRYEVVDGLVRCLNAPPKGE